MVFQLQSQPQMKDEIISQLRRRGIGFELTDGIRSLVASKSGNNAMLRRTLEEAERRRVNPVASALPPTSETRQILERSREATLTATEKMPDFLVKQVITRNYALGNSHNWIPNDYLTVAVSFREGIGEKYKVLSVNGVAQTASASGGTTGETDNGQNKLQQSEERNSYEQLGGSSSTGEFVSILAELFTNSSEAKFQAVDTDTINNRRGIVYDYEIKQENSRHRIKYGKYDGNEITVGTRGRVWIDRENYRILRLESIATEIPSDYPVTEANNTIDYDWVIIADKEYLLPVRAVVEISAGKLARSYQTRNEIRFRNYQKYGSEVQLLDDVPDLSKDNKNSGDEPPPPPPRMKPKP
ncbi:MAG: hypothetical protein ACRD4L_10675 [Pyrinomonadaceae bacterium]